MTKKDYIVLARAMNKAYKSQMSEASGMTRKIVAKSAFGVTVDALCEALASDNPTFKPEVFKSVCYAN